MEEESLEAMTIALRVLAALTSRTPADEDDVVRLREYAPDAANLPADELACEVIERVMKELPE